MNDGREDLGIDARLRRALASAPDAQVEPPAVLDEAILRAAHAAVPKPAAMSGPRESQGFFALLKRWWTHPAAAPVFAVLALSTVIVSMWTRHGIPSPTADDDNARVAAAPASDPAKASPPVVVGGADTAAHSAVPAAPATPAAPAAPTAAPAVTASDALSAPIAELRNSVQTEEEGKEKARAEAKAIAAAPTPAPRASPNAIQLRRQSADPRKLADKKADPAPPLEEAGPRTRQESAAARRDAERDAPVVPAQVPREVAPAPAPAMAPPSPSPAPPSTPSTPSAQQGRASAGAFAPSDGRASAPAIAKSPAVGSVASTLAQSAPTAPSRDASLHARLVAQDAPPLARMLDATANWQWRPEPSQPLAPIDDRARAWFARLAAASQGRWVSADRAAKTERSAETRVFELWRDQAPWATIVIGPTDVTWLEASGRIWRADLAAEALAALRNW